MSKLENLVNRAINLKKKLQKELQMTKDYLHFHLKQKSLFENKNRKLYDLNEEYKNNELQGQNMVIENKLNSDKKKI